MKYRLTSAAEEEYAASVLFFLEDSPQSALEMIEEIESSISEIASFPERFPVYKDDLRVKHIPAYRFSIFYRVYSDHVLIVSISHDAREEGHWSNRL